MGESLTNDEWCRLYETRNGDTTTTSSSSSSSSSTTTAVAPKKFSPAVIEFLLHLSSILNRTICPADALLPCPSVGHVTSLGIVIPNDHKEEQEELHCTLLFATLSDTIRCALFHCSLQNVMKILSSTIEMAESPYTMTNNNNTNHDKV
jgi:hypothetical protein